MEIAMSCLGEKNEVWNAVAGFAKSRAILAEEGREETTNSIRFDICWRSWIHVIHTGASAELILALTDKYATIASAKFLTGSVWELIMAAAVDNVEAVFSQASFLQRRTVLIEAGKKLH